jgi:ABC-type bacteriocin/lantibiotic exporter with double-glycine peptidase domain
MSKTTPIKRLYGLLSTEKRDIYRIYFFAIFNGIIQLSIPLGVQSIINLLMAGRISTSWIIITIFVMLGTLMGGLIQILQLSISENIQQRLFSRSAFEFSFRFPRLKEHSNQIDAPDLSNRFFDTINLQKSLSKLLTDLPAAVIQIVAGIALLSFYHPAFLFFGGGLTLLLYLIFRFTGPKGLATSLKESIYKYRVAFWLQEVARNIFSQSMTAHPEIAVTKTDGLVNHYLDQRQAHFRVLITQYTFIVVFKVLITGALLGLGGYLVLNGALNLGQFVASEIVILLVIGSAEKLILSTDKVYDLLTAADKIGYFTDMPLDGDKAGLLSEGRIDRPMALRFMNLDVVSPYFRESGTRGISIEVPAGASVCISGGSNTEKSWFLHLLSRLPDELNGHLQINERPLPDINRSDYRRKIALLNRHEYIFKGTLAQNIQMNRHDPEARELLRVSEIARLRPFADSLPEGFQTPLNHMGEGLPGTVIQQILLARALFSAPSLFLLDEVELHTVDEHRERFYDFLTNPAQGWTLMAVSHDAEFASRCSHLLIFEAGKVAYFGPANDGLAPGSPYKRYFHTKQHHA